MKTLVDVLRIRARDEGDRMAYLHLSDPEGVEERFTFAEVERRVSAVAAHLAREVEPGERALLLYPPGPDYLFAFLGCLASGVVAVPAYPPTGRQLARQIPRLQQIAADAAAAVALTTSPIRQIVDESTVGALARLRWLVTDTAPAAPPSWVPTVNADRTAFLQYTSGSTSSPRGVVVTHDNLMHNSRCIAARLLLGPEAMGVSWLPPYHDMGLIGGLLQTVASGMPMVLMSPLAFLQRPLRWLQAISRYRATHSGGPNFAYELCLRKITPAQRDELDLRSWQVAFTGAEPIQADTLDRFAAFFAPSGFSRAAFLPSYGLAETTLLAACRGRGEPLETRGFARAALGQRRVEPCDDAEASVLVGCGAAPPDHELAIVDPETCLRCPPGRIGEIWISGPSVAVGYFGRPRESDEVFRARLLDAPERTWLRSGDLGFFHDQSLYVAARLKDLLVIDGRNHYPQDLERTAERSHPELRPGCAAAFSICVDGVERVAVVCELNSRAGQVADEALAAIRRAIAAEHGIGAHHIVLVEPGGVPKTSSGKIQRRACCQALLQGALPLAAEFVRCPSAVRAWIARKGPLDRAQVEEALVAAIADHLGELPSAIDVEAPLSAFGIDSVFAVSVTGDLEEWLGIPLSPTLLYEQPSLARIAARLVEEREAARAKRTESGGQPAEGETTQMTQPDRTTELSPQKRALLAQIQARTEATRASEPIAIVGMGCRFPKADGPEAFWRLLHEGRCAIDEVPRDRWNIDALYDPTPGLPGRMYTRWGGFLDNVDRFDPQFFGISPREATHLDPQQRLLLEVSWEALEDAGLAPSRLAGSQGGVFIGMCNEDYSSLKRNDDPTAIDPYSGTGVALSVAAGRLAYVFGLHGPTMTIDTACSSSLVALHLACQSLRSGECNLALAGGVNLILSPRVTIYFCQVRAMSPTGRCRTFDADADGYVRSEGCGIVVLKRLKDALAAGDRIAAVVRGSAVNHDGHSGGLTVPSGQAQQAVVQRALAMASLSPADIGYIEAHGTGTPLGDPIEVRALEAVFGKERPAGRPLRIGSVKTNLGHLESAAGVAGLIKVALSLRHGEIPPHLHLQQLNPHVSLAAMQGEVPTSAVPWTEQRIAGVSSFGISGTNAHVILTGPPENQRPVERAAATSTMESRPWLLPISARHPKALEGLAASYRDLIAKERPAPADLCHSATQHRDALDERLVVAFRNHEELIERLDAFVRGERRLGIASGRRIQGRQARLVFVFPGQGSQWLGMGRELLATEPVFREVIDRCEQAFRPHVDWSLHAELKAEPSQSRMEEIDVVQPMLFAVEIALAALWRSWGIEPAAVVGQSMGEVAAAYVAGALDLDDAARIICRRSRLLKRVSGQGAMAVVELSMADTERALAGWEDKLSVAVASGARSTVVAGDPAALDQLLADLERREVFCRRIKVDVASHSPQMDSLRDDLRRELDGLRPRPSTIPFYSTVTGGRADELELGTSYWIRNLRDPVLLEPALKLLIEDGKSLFLEVSPHPVLLPAIESALEGSRGAAVASLRRDISEPEALATAVGALFAAGQTIDWKRIKPADGRFIPLPHYAWQKERYWLEDTIPFDGRPPASVGGAATGHALLGDHVQSSAHPGTHFFQTRLDLKMLPFLADHRIGETVIFPAAGYLEMALAAAQFALGEGKYALSDVSFKKALVLQPQKPRLVQVVLTTQVDDTLTFRVSAEETTAGTRTWTPCATGRVNRVDSSGADEKVELAEAKARSRAIVTSEGHYQTMTRLGLQYGSAFQVVRQIWCLDGEAVAHLALPPTAGAIANFRLHPALLDGCFQLLAQTIPSELLEASQDDVWVPVGLRELRLHGEPSGRWAWARLLPAEGGEELEGDVLLVDEEGTVSAEVRGLRVRRIDARPGSQEDERADDLFYRLTWREAPLPAAAPLTGTWLVVADGEWATALRDLITAAGATCMTFASDVLLGGQLGEQLPAGVRGIVHALGATLPDNQSSTVAMMEAQRAGCESLVQLVQALARAGLQELPRLWVITSGGQAVLEGEDVAVGQAPIWGLTRSLAMEMPELRATRVDVGRSGGELASLCRVLGADEREDQVGLRGERRFVARLVQGLAQAAAPPEEIPVVDGDPPFRLEAPRAGILDNLEFRPLARRPPGPDEIEIAVRAAGVNFSDVMKALGVYPGGGEGPPSLGGECSGVVVRVGARVETFRPGDAVVGVALRSFASHVTIAATHAARIPKGWSFEQAATVPVAFLTAYYALKYQARLAPGERVLIHAASGGVGLAAIQIAQLLGAEVFATAGSPEKRAFVEAQGVKHIFDSRSLAFADEILRRTGGQGIDAILNSLAGPAIPRGLSILRPFGRFLEIGSRDIYMNAPLDMGLLQKNISFTAIHLGRAFDDRPALMIELFREILALFESGALRPLAAEVFPISRAVEAFHRMAQAKHIGKIVFTSDGAEVRVRSGDAGPPMDPKGVTLITGGLGALGLHVARGLVAQGARHLALLGRTAETDASEETRAALAELRQSGASVTTHACDVADEEKLARVLAEIEADGTPLKGVIHAAGLLDDCMLLQLDHERLTRVMLPKVAGAWNLHRLTRDRQLDFFVLFSSGASLVGSPGQANYAAANAFLDALAHHRRAQGLPALAINWGPWTEGGLADHAHRGGRLALRGIESLTAAQGVRTLGRLMQQSAPQVAAFPVRLTRWQKLFPELARAPLLSELVRDAGVTPRKESPLRRQLLELDPGPRRRALLEGHLLDQIAQVLRIPRQNIDVDTPLNTLGFDSLMALELRNRLEASLGVTLSATMAWNYPTVGEIAPHLAEKMGAPLHGSAPVATPTPSAAPVVPSDDLMRIVEQAGALREHTDE